MTKEREPRLETETERTEAYRGLRKVITRQLRLHGVPSIMIRLDGRRVISATERTFHNPRRDEVFSLSRTHIELEEPKVTLDKNEIDETETLRQTQYIARGREPFTRGDFSGDILEGSSPEDQARHSERMAEHLTANLGALASGITGHPITAEEANDLIDLVRDAEPIPDPLGRTAAGF